MNNFSLLYMLRLALKYIYFLIAAAVVFAGASLVYCKLLATPEYSATGSVLVTNGAIISSGAASSDTASKSVSNTDITASLQLSNTIIDILKTNGIYKQLADSFEGEYTYSELISRAEVKRRSTDTLFIDITFTAQTADEAKELVNGFLELAPEYILEFIPNSNAAVTTTADTAAMTYPRTALFTMTAAAAGALLSYIVIYIISYFNTTIKTEADIKENYDILLLGNIPDFSSAGSKGYYKYNSYNNKGGLKHGRK